MLRWTIPLVVAIAAVGSAAGPDEAFARRGVYRAAARLPAGLPRAHYNFRTTVSWAAPALYRPRYALPGYGYETPDALFAPSYAAVPYMPPLPVAPLLPAYYEPAYAYGYGGEYYNGPYVGYWERVPYACSLYGYYC
jgi:hypothetical protein